MKNIAKPNGFTLIELLVVIAVIGVLMAVLMPALSSVRGTARQVQGMTQLKHMAIGWHAYSMDHDSTMIPGRFAKLPGGTANPQNHFRLDNGMKYRPRWIAVLGLYQGVSAFSEPSTTDDRQDYTSEFFVCPAVGDRVDERNSSYGYNLQFLGNARKTNGEYHNFPVRQHAVKSGDLTVIAADSLGTAAGAALADRLPYDNDGTTMQALSNHGWSLDPPRLTDVCDRGTGDPGSLRTAVDPRHRGDRSNVVFVDGHAALMTPEDLGYRTDATGAYVNDPGSTDGPPATNKHFSGTARDTDPPALPELAP